VEASYLLVKQSHIFFLIEIIFGLKSLSFTRPAIIQRRVDLPVPLGPTTVTISEVLATKETDLCMFTGCGFLVRL